MADNTGSITRTIKFYAEEQLYKDWYADIPEYIEAGGEKADLQMVAGADVLLDILSKHGDSIMVKFSNEPFEGANEMSICNKKCPSGLYDCVSGSYYFIEEIDGKTYSDAIWLCDVTLFVFNGEFPETIYYQALV